MLTISYVVFPSSVTPSWNLLGRRIKCRTGSGSSSYFRATSVSVGRLFFSFRSTSRACLFSLLCILAEQKWTHLSKRPRKALFSSRSPVQTPSSVPYLRTATAGSAIKAIPATSKAADPSFPRNRRLVISAISYDRL